MFWNAIENENFMDNIFWELYYKMKSAKNIKTYRKFGINAIFVQFELYELYFQIRIQTVRTNIEFSNPRIRIQTQTASLVIFAFFTNCTVRFRTCQFALHWAIIFTLIWRSGTTTKLKSKVIESSVLMWF